MSYVRQKQYTDSVEEDKKTCNHERIKRDKEQCRKQSSHKRRTLRKYSPTVLFHYAKQNSKGKQIKYSHLINSICRNNVVSFLGRIQKVGKRNCVSGHLECLRKLLGYYFSKAPGRNRLH